MKAVRVQSHLVLVVSSWLSMEAWTSHW